MNRRILPIEEWTFSREGNLIIIGSHSVPYRDRRAISHTKLALSDLPPEAQQLFTEHDAAYPPQSRQDRPASMASPEGAVLSHSLTPNRHFPK